jgi:peptide/nickel transport system permease protein
MTTPLVQAETAKPTTRRHVLRTLFSSVGGTLGASWLLFIVLASITSPLWIPYPTTHQDFAAVLSGPSAAHWLGTDELGRDILSRIFAAGASTLGTSALGALVAIAVSVPLALHAASRGDRTEGVVNRITEIVMSVPAIIIILAVIGVVGTNVAVVMVIFGLLVSAGVYRVFLGQAKSLQKQLYVDAATVDGARPFRISVRHVLPGLLNTITVQFALIFAIGLIVQAGLAFIGFGPPIPQPSWGGMIQSASQHIYDAPWLMVPTGLVLALTVISANAVADALSKTADAPAPQIVLGRAAKQGRLAAQAARAGSSSIVPTSAPGLTVRGLTLGITGGQTLVSDVSLRVAPGSVLGLVGESGCGKTLTALSLIGLLPPGISPSAGSIEWNGRDLATLTERELSSVRGHEIGLISQEPMRALDPMFTIDYQLTSAIRRLQGIGKREARAQAASLLERVGIVDAGGVLRSYPHQISGGMAQRVAIALALAGKPKLLVADEPTTALDVTVQAEILSLLRQLIADTGMAMVMVTHDLGVVADICDEVAVMYAGQVVETGSVTSVLEDAQHPYTMALLAADPHAATGGVALDRLASIPGQVPQPKDWPTGCRFAARCQFATPECATLIALTPRLQAEGSVRCVRAVELAQLGEHWGKADADVVVDSIVPVELAERVKELS